MREFSVNDLIREVIAENGLTGPDLIAKEVARRIPGQELATAVDQLLPQHVRVILHEGGPGAPASQGSPDTQMLPAGGERRGPTRRDAIAAWWQRELTHQYHAGRGEWRRLADFTVADCLFAAAEREKQAQLNTARAAWFTALAETMTRCGAATAGELPEKEAATVLRRDGN